MAPVRSPAVSRANLGAEPWAAEYRSANESAKYRSANKSAAIGRAIPAVRTALGTSVSPFAEAGRGVAGSRLASTLLSELPQP